MAEEEEEEEGLVGEWGGGGGGKVGGGGGGKEFTIHRCKDDRVFLSPLLVIKEYSLSLSVSVFPDTTSLIFCSSRFEARYQD